MLNRRKIKALAISLTLHAILLAAVIYQHGYHIYRSMEGLKVGDYGGQSTVRLINPADYGLGRKPAIAAPPRRAMKLEQLEKRAKAEAASRRKVKQEQQTEKPAEATEQTASVQAAAAQPANELKFGRLDTHPIKQHVAVLWQAHEAGNLDVPDRFRISAVCKVNTDGSLSGIRIIESSGSAEMDRTAFAILAEVSSQRAFAPLSRLSSVSVTLEVGSGSASFSIVGFAPDAALASDMASQYQLMISAARLLTSNSQTKAMLNQASVRSDLNRVSARLTVPRSLASQMMHEGFSKSE